MDPFPAAQPHGPLQEIADGVFWVQGTMRMAPGVRINRNMVVVRSDDELTLISSVRLSDEEEKRLTELGTVKHVVKIGYFHDYDDRYYVSRFGADYWALADGTRHAEPKVTRVLSEDASPIRDATVFVFRGAAHPEAALLVDRAGGILVTCDAIQNWPDTARCSVPGKLICHLMGFTRRRAQIGPPWRKTMTPAGGSLKPDFERLAGLQFEHLVGAHGAVLSGTAMPDLQATITATFP